MKAKNPFLYKIIVSGDTWDSWDDDGYGISWCSAQFGMGGIQKGSKWYCILDLTDEDSCFNSVTFLFRDKNDCISFAEKHNQKFIQMNNRYEQI
jgi:hypothetical protein